jgi:hypothetical protein
MKERNGGPRLPILRLALCVLHFALAAPAVHVPYLSYARQLYKLSRQQGISGESFALVAKVLLDKLAARGLNADVLAAIRTEVFDVVAPTP